MPRKVYDVVALACAAVDLLVNVPDAVLERENLEKGITNYVSPETLARLTPANETTRATGGPGTNVVMGVAVHGGSAGLIAKIANDDNGRFYTSHVLDDGIAFMPTLSTEGPTTSIAALTTPDKERTFACVRGVGENLAPEDLDRTLIAEAKIIYLDAFLCLSESGLEAAAEAAAEAHATGGKVALALNNIVLSDTHRDGLAALSTQVDILVGDQREFIKFFGVSTLKEAEGEIQKRGVVAAVTAGSNGAYIVADTVTHIPASPVAIVDTNGAGDQFAAGFLYGLAQGKTPAESGKLGAAFAAEILQQKGAEPHRIPERKFSA